MSGERLLPERCTVSAVVAATPEQVWAVVADPCAVGTWSHEATGAEWLDGADAATPGARFRGRNRMGRNRWTRTSEIVVADAPRELVWRTVPTVLYRDTTTWRIRLEPVAGGTRIEQSYELQAARWVRRMLWLVAPAHRDRTAALTEDLERLGRVASGR